MGRFNFYYFWDVVYIKLLVRMGGKILYKVLLKGVNIRREGVWENNW